MHVSVAREIAKRTKAPSANAIEADAEICIQANVKAIKAAAGEGLSSTLMVTGLKLTKLQKSKIYPLVAEHFRKLGYVVRGFIVSWE